MTLEDLKVNLKNKVDALPVASRRVTGIVASGGVLKKSDLTEHDKVAGEAQGAIMVLRVLEDSEGESAATIAENLEKELYASISDREVRREARALITRTIDLIRFVF